MKKESFLLLALFVSFSIFPQQNIIKVPKEGIDDYTDYIRKALENNNQGSFILEFEEGTYNFYPERALGMYIRISNNDNSYKKVVFNLTNIDNVHISGKNSNFIFHGSVVPFYINNSKNISISGVSFDYDYSFIFEGEVISNNQTAKSIDLKLNDNVKYRITGHRLFFEGYDWSLPLGENIVFDKERKAPYYNTSKYDHWDWKRELIAEDLGERKIRLTGFTKEVPPIGSIYTDKGPHGRNRMYPGIILHSSENITLRDINIYMSGAMALIGENTSDVELKNFNVNLKEGSNRFISASADATHFVNCGGSILIEDCLFENMLDDATNVHGTYMKVDEVGDNYLAVRFGHYQQEGFKFAQEGDTLRVIDRKNLQPQFSIITKKVKWVNDDYGLIYTDSPLPKEMEETNLAIENITNMPSLIMRNCTVRNNRARSILISTTKKILVENNYFDSMMAGVLIAGDANKWFESSGVSDVVIRRNTFVNIGKGGANPQSVLQISPEIPIGHRGNGYYHGTILFEDNIIRTFDSQVIYGLSIKNLVIRNNKFIKSEDFKPIFTDLSFIDLQNCKDVSIYGNSYLGSDIVEVSATDCEKVELETQKGFNKNIVEKPNTFFYQQ